MTQFSFEWILSLNWPSHFWGPLHSAPEVRVLLYLHLRASRFGICYPTFEEIVHELGLTGKKNLLPHIKSLEQKRFISTRTNAGRTFFLIHDPRVAIKHLSEKGVIRENDLFEINELYADLNQTPVADNQPTQEEHDSA
ncbi:MAG: helix-turn-helix domain-containing protein [Acidobacteriia bacterium]|nr:helix-turn-helix domain-containing protein [Terriglobia bacterium]